MEPSIEELQIKFRSGSRWDKWHVLLSIMGFTAEYVRTDSGSTIAKIRSRKLDRFISYGIGSGYLTSLEKAVVRLRQSSPPPTPIGPIAVEDIAVKSPRHSLIPFHPG